MARPSASHPPFRRRLAAGALFLLLAAFDASLALALPALPPPEKCVFGRARAPGELPDLMRGPPNLMRDTSHQYTGHTYPAIAKSAVSVSVDASLNVTRVVDELGIATNYTYTPGGYVTSVTAAAGTTQAAKLAISYATIAGAERPTQFTFPSGQTASIAYNANSVMLAE